MPCNQSCQNGSEFYGEPLQVLAESADPDQRIFPWSMPARYYQKPSRMLVYGTCLVAGKTRKGDEFSKEELERHGCTLIHGPIETFAHSWQDGQNHWLSYPENVILDAEEVGGRLEYIAGIEDEATKQAILNKEITGVSVNTICRRVPADDPGKCLGMILNGFCLLGKESIPASPGTSVKAWNCLKGNPLRLKTESSECASKAQKTEAVAETKQDKPPETSPKPPEPAKPEPAPKEEKTSAVAAVVPVDKLPASVFVVKVEEIEAIAADRRLFTPALKLRAILNLCEDRRTEAH